MDFTLPTIAEGTSRRGRMANRSRNAFFRSNQIVRDHVVNYSDTTLQTLTLKQKRMQRPKGKAKHVKVGNEIMKATAAKNVTDFEKRQARRAKLLRKQRIVFLFTRIQNRAVEKIQKKVKDFLLWREEVRREEAATFLASFYRRLKTRRMWREIANGAGLMRKRVVDGLCRAIQRSAKLFLWRKARVAAAAPLQRLVHTYLARRRTARQVRRRKQVMARRLGRWARRMLRRKHAREERNRRAAARARRRDGESAAVRARAKEKRIAKRRQRQEISKITYARKQFLLEARAHYNIANWLNSRGLTTRLERHADLRLTDDEAEEADGECAPGAASPDARPSTSGGRPLDLVLRVPGLSRKPATTSQLLRRPRTAQGTNTDTNTDARRQQHRSHNRQPFSPKQVAAAAAAEPEVFVPEGVEDWVDFFMTNERWSVEKSKIRGMELSFTMLEEGRRRLRSRAAAGGGGGGGSGGARGTHKFAASKKSDAGQKKPLFANVKLTQVWELFKTMDTDGNGQISPKEFQTAMAKLGEEFTDTEVEKVFAFVDTNDSGGISIAELQAAMAIYQRKYGNVVERRKRFGKAQIVMNQIYAKRLGGHVKDELDEAIAQVGSRLVQGWLVVGWLAGWLAG